MLLKREDHLCQDNTTLSDHPQSDLTFSGPAGNKKRPYMTLSHHNNLLVQSRLYGSAGATNSGQPAAVTASVTVPPIFSEDFISDLNCQNVDTDVLVRYQMERLKSGMEILRIKHCRDLLSVVQQQAVKRLRVKDVELETLNQRNRELEEQVRLMSNECQVWFNYAKTTESAISGLREKLDQVLTHQNASPVLEEGYGDNGDQFPAAGEAESVYQADVDTELRASRRACRVCQEREACVLLLPCRHLCLCKSCEPMIDNCPVCSSTRNASIQVVVP